jgi:stage II sporulation protein R
MKKLKSAILLIVLMSAFVLTGCGDTNNLVRIHIRANSNSSVDQNVKLEVRDSVIDLITPLIAECDNSEEVKSALNENLPVIEQCADEVLSSSGFDYVSRARICNEYFPSRSYGGEVYPADYYDALIIELGSGKGDNWWCVAYPPLCFVGEGVGNVQYRSKLLDMISRFFGD